MNYGALTLKSSGKVLKFILGPSSFSITKKFNFEEIPLYGLSHPLVCFQNCGAAVIQVQAQFHQDLEPPFTPSHLFDFLKELEQIEAETRSVSTVEFAIGPIRYDCVIQKVNPKITHALEDGRPFGLDLEITLISPETPTRSGLIDPESGYDFRQTPSSLQPGPQVASAGALSGLLQLVVPGIGAPAIIPMPSMSELDKQIKKYTFEKAKKNSEITLGNTLQENTSEKENIENSTEANQPKINKQKQAGHIKGTPQYNNRVKQGKVTSSWDEGKDPDQLTTEAWKKGNAVQGRPEMKEYDFGQRIGTSSKGNPLTKVRVSIDSRGEIHGHPR